MKKVGRYVINSELGRGAMGIVYRALDPTIDREVALKVLSISATREEGTNSPQEMFMREVRAAGRLAHPSIVVIYDAFDDQENQTSCIVMELVPGVTLEKLLQSGRPLTTEQLLSIIRQVADGLDYAHRNRVIHRDLKPANILVTDDGRAKITDFGIAKVLAREGVARTIGIMGTPSYMSPEQVRGGEVDARTDIFSLGIMIFTMLTGQKPFSGNTAAVMFKIVYEEPALPSSVNSQLTPAHDHLIKKCLAKDRNQRYSSARELLNDLDDLQHGRPLRSQAVVPAVARPAPSPVAAPSMDRTMAMRIPDALKAASKPPSPRPGSPITPAVPPSGVAAQPPNASAPVSPSESRGPATASLTPRAEPTVAMPTSGFMKAAPAPPAPAQPPKLPLPPPRKSAPLPQAGPMAGQTMPMRVPDLSGVAGQTPSSTPRAPAAPTQDDSAWMERTLPMQVPDLSGRSSPASSLPYPAPADSVPAEPRPMEEEIRAPLPDFSAAPPATGPELAPSAPFFSPESTQLMEPEETPAAEAPTPKSKLAPILVGGVGVVLVAAAAISGYWKFHPSKAAPAPPLQVAVQIPAVTPPPVTAPESSPIPPVAPSVQQSQTPASAAPAVARKTGAHKPKQVIVEHPSAPEPVAEPVVAAPPPKPVPSTPSPAEIARAEAAKLANTPRIVQVVCNYGLKEATFTFSSGSQALYAETSKGKKKKGGFLGIKGSFEGTFSHTITVPAGAAEVSLHVVSRDGATDLSKTIKMPPPGGFVPTLTVEIDSEHLSLSWKSSAGAP